MWVLLSFLVVRRVVVWSLPVIAGLEFEHGWNIVELARLNVFGIFLLTDLKIMETRHILNYRNEWWRNSTSLLQLWYIIWYILYTLYKDNIHILCIIINHVNGTYIYIDNNTAYNVLWHHSAYGPTYLFIWYIRMPSITHILHLLAAHSLTGWWRWWRKRQWCCSDR